MTKPNDPVFAGTCRDCWKKIPSITKREWFAGLAMQGLLAGSGGITSWHEKNFAIGAINLADALLAELGKETK